MARLLATPADVADLWRPLSSDEVARVANLIEKASSQLRQKVPAVDARMDLFAANPSDLRALDPVTVATVVATIVKRFLSNVDGASSVTETTGPYSVSRSFNGRDGEDSGRGTLVVTAADVAALSFPSSTAPRVGTIRVLPLMAPGRFGDVPYTDDPRLTR